MPIKSHITDPSTGIKATVDNTTGEAKGLVVASRPLKIYTNSPKIFADADGNIDMNIGVAFGANPEEVYDGGDRASWGGVADWVFSIAVGGPSDFDEASTDHAKNGNIKFTNNTIDDITITFTLSTGALGVITEGVDWNKGINVGASADALAVYLNGGGPAAITAVSDSTDSVMVYTTTTSVDLQSIVIGGANAGNVTATAQSIDAEPSEANDIFQLTRGAGDLDTTNYIAITGWIYITTWQEEGAEISGWDSGASTAVGNAVNIVDYVAQVANKWQQFTILLEDMGLQNVVTTFDALRVTTKHNLFNYYIDYIEIQATSTVNPTIYSIMPEDGTWLYVHELKWSIADEIDTTLANGTMPNLFYDRILGVPSLASGIAYQRLSDNVAIESATLNQLSDWLYQPGTQIVNEIHDDTNTFITIKTLFTEPLLLKSEDKDKIRFQVNDNLSGLLYLRCTASCKEEQRENSH